MKSMSCIGYMNGCCNKSSMSLMVTQYVDVKGTMILSGLFVIVIRRFVCFDMSYTRNQLLCGREPETVQMNKTN